MRPRNSIAWVRSPTFGSSRNVTNSVGFPLDSCSNANIRSLPGSGAMNIGACQAWLLYTGSTVNGNGGSGVPTRRVFSQRSPLAKPYGFPS